MGERTVMEPGAPRVVLSSFGRYHMYTVAEALAARGALEAVFTADLKAPPRSIAGRAHRFPAALSLACRVAGRSGAGQGLASLLWRRFDGGVASRLAGLAARSGANIFHGFSLFCLQSLRRAREAEMVRIVERAGTHILTQMEEVEQEAAAAGEGTRLRASAYYRNADRMMEEYEEADYILTCSEYARQSFLKRGVAPSKVVSIPLGANFAGARVDRRASDPFRVLCVGVNAHIKGVAYLLRAWREADLPGAELRLRVALPPSLRHLADRPDVTLLPPMDWRQLQEEYRRASVFCLPSVDDGFGMVVLEAMSFGVPPVVSTHVGAAEVLRPGVDGLVFPVRDVHALAGCLAGMYQDRERTIWMGENARQRAREYSWERYADRLIAFYCSALAAGETRHV